MYRSARNETIRQRQQYQERRQRRMDNKVSGVSTDTSLKHAAASGASDNVSEIRPDPALLQDFPIYMMNQPHPEPSDPDRMHPDQPVRQDKTQAGGRTRLQAGFQTESRIKTQKESQSEPQIQQELAVAGMGYPGLMPFPAKTEAGGMESFDNIIPITNRKVALQPNAADTVPGTAGAVLPEADSGTQSMEEDLLMRSRDIFSDLFPDDAEERAGRTELTGSGQSAENISGRTGTGQFTENISVGTGRQTEDASDGTGTGHRTEDASDRPASGQPEDALWSPVRTDSADSQDHVLEEEDESGQELPDLPPVSAEELMEQQLLAVSVPEKVSAVAPVSDTSSGQEVPKQSAAQIHKPPKQSAAETAGAVAAVQMQMRQEPVKIKREYVLPPVELLNTGDPKQTGDTREHLQETALKLQQTLKNFGVNVSILNVSCGPSVTRYEIQPEMGVKVSKIVNLADDIKLNLAAADIRIEAPIPGKAAIGIEVPNKETVPVMFRDLIESDAFRKQTSPCTFAAGKDISGQVVVTDICKMPHLLIAGATGSGKSVCINTIIMSIIYKANPDDVKLIMIDPKVVELSVYNGIPHLLLPVVTDPKKAAGALHWAVSEMTDRYQKFTDYGVRDVKGYNAKIKKITDIPEENRPQKMPYIVIIVDELADLMMTAPGDVEDAICRLAQLARAAGIHLIIATQRPSVNVITGLIKANMPSRIAFSVTSGIDSRTILDMNGAEKLLGKGDMLFYPQGYLKPVRVQGAFVSDTEVSDVVEFLKERNGMTEYSHAIEQQVADASGGSGGSSQDAGAADDKDVYFADAARLLMDKEKASVSMLQRYFKIGFNRAARIMDQLEEAGVVGPEDGTKPRKILMSPEEFEQYEEEVL